RSPGAAITAFGLRDNRAAGIFPRLDNDADGCAENSCYAAEHAERVTLVRRRFQAADVLLRSLDFASKLLLRKASLFAQRRELHRNIPSFARFFEPLGEGRVFQLFVEVKIEVGFFHANLSCQSRIRSD